MRNRARALFALATVITAALLLIALTGASSPTSAQATHSRHLGASQGRTVQGSSPATCPSSSPWNDGAGTPQPKSGRPGSAQTLVPGTPVGALICVYSGLPEPGIQSAGFGLVGERILKVVGATQLARTFNALSPSPTSGAAACPSDEGMGATVYFRYVTGSDAQISVSTSGCTRSSNGYLTRLFFPPIINGVHSTKVFIDAHEATVTGRVCDLSLRPRCVAPMITGLRVELSSDRLLRGNVAVRDGHFSGQTTSGTTTVTIVQNVLSDHPVDYARARRTLLPGQVTTSTFWVS